MEIIRGTVSTVGFTLPTPDSAVTAATWSRGGTTGGTLTPGPPVNRVVTVTLPYQQYDGPLTINWNITVPGSGSFVETSHYEVVTPILTDAEVLAILEDADDDYSVEDARRIEKSVRHIIQAHTGQSFGKSVASMRVPVSSRGATPLPRRLLRSTKINGYAANSTEFSISGDGWWIRSALMWGVPPIRADIDGYNVATMQIDAPIRSPYAYGANNFIEIEGEWGWDAVPEAVREAARLLVNDYATDTIYRDRYLASMTAADWRIQFNSGAFRQTGNVRADQLLNEYTLKQGWAVL